MSFSSNHSPRLRASLLLLPALLLAAAKPPRVPASLVGLRFTVGTLHAAALTTSRSASDSIDEPYFIVSTLEARSEQRTIHLPASGHLRIRENEALGESPLVDLNVAPGDTVRVLVSVLEGPVVGSGDEAALTASAKALVQSSAGRAGTLSLALQPVIAGGAHWLGSATLLATNDGGTMRWLSLDCVATCKVLSGAGASVIAAAGAAPAAGVVELSGHGGTYHLALRGQLTP